MSGYHKFALAGGITLILGWIPAIAALYYPESATWLLWLNQGSLAVGIGLCMPLWFRVAKYIWEKS